MILEGLEVGAFMSNTFIVGCEETKEAALFDPGADPERIAKRVEGLGLKVRQIFATHAHIDHIGAVAALKETYGAPFMLCRSEELLVKAYDQQCRMFGIRIGSEPEIDGFLTDGQEIHIGRVSAKVIFTPGHSPGGICFLFDKKVIVGDTLFNSSIGRTDLFGGDFDTLIKSIKTRLFILPDDTEVFCGHGPATTIGREKSFNPFLS